MVERSLSKSHYTLMHKINIFSIPSSMSGSPQTISMSDEEDVCICKHEVAIEKAKCAKEEQQRQWEEEA